jgi:hypothetical protein
MIEGRSQKSLSPNPGRKSAPRTVFSNLNREPLAPASIRVKIGRGNASVDSRSELTSTYTRMPANDARLTHISLFTYKSTDVDYPFPSELYWGNADTLQQYAATLDHDTIGIYAASSSSSSLAIIFSSFLLINTIPHLSPYFQST